MPTASVVQILTASIAPVIVISGVLAHDDDGRRILIETQAAASSTALSGDLRQTLSIS